jgi:serine/threonine protein kinase
MPTVTRTGAVLGTIGYMAPEQALGEPGLDHRADIFSLGCVLYEALAGQAPFSGGSAVEVLTKIHTHDPARLRSIRPEIPLHLELLIHAMLAKRPEHRPACAQATIAALSACAS